MDVRSAEISLDLLAASVKDLRLYCESRFKNNDSTTGHHQVLMICRDVSSAIDELQLALLYHQEVGFVIPSNRESDVECAKVLRQIYFFCRSVFKLLASQVDSGILKPAGFPVHVPATLLAVLQNAMTPICAHATGLRNDLRQACASWIQRWADKTPGLQAPMLDMILEIICGASTDQDAILADWWERVAEKCTSQAVLTVAKLGIVRLRHSAFYGSVKIDAKAEAEFFQLAATAAEDATVSDYFRLSLADRNMQCIPEHWPALVADNLTQLFLSRNPLQGLPLSLTLCRQLRVLCVRRTQLTELPRVLFLLGTLEQLDVSENAITEIPPGIANLDSLKGLDLKANQISYLPGEFGRMGQLDILSLLPNPLRQPPVSFHNLLSLMALLETSLTGETATEIATRNLTCYIGIQAGHRLPANSTEELHLCVACGELDLREEDAQGRIHPRVIMKLPRFSHFREWVRSELQESAKCGFCDPAIYGIYKLGDTVSCGCQMHWDCRKSFTIRRPEEEGDLDTWDRDEGVY